jgi:hypothetical protein
MKIPVRAWGWLDLWSHRLHLPGPVRGWICNRYDTALGIYEDDDLEEVDDGA